MASFLCSAQPARAIAMKKTPHNRFVTRAFPKATLAKNRTRGFNWIGEITA